MLKTTAVCHKLFGADTCIAGNQAPAAHVEPQSAVVDVGSPVEFYCYATGYPTPRIEWTRSDGQVMPSDAVIDDGVLRFHAASVQHEGQYLCTALNVVGSDQQTATVTVRSG